MLGMGLGLTALCPRVAWTPAQIPGLAAWYDPSDLATLFQDTEMTVPVTADGQAVAAVMDKSGRGRHLLQPTASLRPIYRSDGLGHWIESDGVDDALTGSFPDMTGAPALTVATAIRPLSYQSVDDRIFQLGVSSYAMSGGISSAAIGWRYNNGNVLFDRIELTVDSTVVWRRAAGATYLHGELFVDGEARSPISYGGMNLVPNITNTTFRIFGGDPGYGASCIRLYGLIIASETSDAEVLSMARWLRESFA